MLASFASRRGGSPALRIAELRLADQLATIEIPDLQSQIRKLSEPPRQPEQLQGRLKN